MTRAATIGAALVVFAVLATANSGGYRFGISDQAYYGAAVVKSIHPAWFPRDSTLLGAQSRHMLSDDLVGWMARTFDLDLPPLFFALYLLTVAALAGGGLVYARGLGASRWAAAALLLLMTLRHRIAKTGANSLEGYWHPRMFAFGLGVAALGAALRCRFMWAAAAVVGAGVLHTTTAMWFAGVVLVAAFVARPTWRRPMTIAAGAAALAGVWMFWLGPLSGHLRVMDEPWLAVLREKDYLFPSAWPVYAWASNLLYVVVVVVLFRRRRRLGILAPGEAGVVAGLLALVAVFLASVPFSAARLAIAVQLQTNRVFWIADVAAIAYVAWWLMDRPAVVRRRWMRAVALAAIAALAAGRGYFVHRVEANRALVQIRPALGAWTDVMDWLATQPSDWHVLADPGHAWKYGESVRLASGKDTVLEMGKDTALAMYDRDVALRVAERARALRAFAEATTADIRELDTQFAIDVVVIENDRTFDLPVLYRNTRFTVYDLR